MQSIFRNIYKGSKIIFFSQIPHYNVYMKQFWVQLVFFWLMPAPQSTVRKTGSFSPSPLLSNRQMAGMNDFSGTKAFIPSSSLAHIQSITKSYPIIVKLSHLFIAIASHPDCHPGLITRFLFPPEFPHSSSSATPP